jgi:D-alanyl-D-alanine carboxypeptidase
VSSPRSAGLIAVVTAMASLTVISSSAVAEARTGAPPSSGSTSGGARDAAREPTSLIELRREAQKATADLEAATQALVKRQKILGASQKRLTQKLAALQVADRELSKAREPLSNMVEYLYQQPAGGNLNIFFSGGDTSGLRAMSDMTHLVDGRNMVFEDTGKLFQKQERLAADAQELRATNLLQEAQLNTEIDTLKKRSAKIVKSLTATLRKLGVRIKKKDQDTACDPTKVNITAQFANGLLPSAYLCPLPQRGYELRADAAIAFVALNEAYRRRFGTAMCVSSSYRSLGAQQAVYYQRPGLAAIPGRSNHGLGLAVDLCGGVQVFRSVQFNWLEANSKKYGFIHPAWAYSSPFEPWHWEYDPKIGSVL